MYEGSLVPGDCFLVPQGCAMSWGDGYLGLSAFLWTPKLLTQRSVLLNPSVGDLWQGTFMRRTHLPAFVTHRVTKLFFLRLELGDRGSSSDTSEPGDPGNSLPRTCFLTGNR